MKVTSTQELKKYAKKLAKKIEQLTGYEAIIYPPMGLRAGIMICWKNKQDIKEGTITITYNNDKVYYDTKKLTNNYPKGSIGDQNGMNIITKQLPHFTKDIWEVAKFKNSI